MTEKHWRQVFNRFVDNTFVFRSVDEFFGIFNGVCLSLKFMMEMEANSELPSMYVLA